MIFGAMTGCALSCEQEGCEEKPIIAELEKTASGEILEQIINKTLSPEKYAELVGLADLHGTVYADRVELHTVYGDITLPRLKKKNFHCMPDWTIQIMYGKRKRFDENTRITITYKTGRKKVLANWDRMKIVSR